MSRRRTVRVLVLIATVAAVLPWQATPALAFVEGPSNNFFGNGAGVNTTGTDNSFFGAGTGGANTTGSENAFFGRNAGGTNTAGNDNAFFGSGAGLFNSTGSSNAFLGRSAGSANTTGSSNAFFGRSAGSANTTGSSNAFFGGSAGAANTTGLSNAFFGRSAGAANTTGVANAFFGESAGVRNTIGSENAFVGRFAGVNNTSGSSNAFFGFAAGHFSNTAASNAFFGPQAGFSNITGNDNAYFGSDAGLANESGVANAFFGSNAGRNISTGTGNTFLGAFSGGLSGITNATAVGHRAHAGQANSLVLGSIADAGGAQNVRVGIGTATPADALHVRRTDGTAKVLVQEASETTLGRTLFQLTNNGASRFRVSNTSNGATWDFQTSGGGGSFVIDRVGGPSSLDLELQPDGDLVARGSVTGTSFISSSDRNLKTDITPANAAKLVAMLRELDISTWRFKTQPEGTINLGPMAQDFHRLFGVGTDTTIQIRDLAALALVAAQQLDGELMHVKQDAEAKDARIGSLEADVAQLKQVVAEVATER